jgi:hypothetical protein
MRPKVQLQVRNIVLPSRLNNNLILFFSVLVLCTQVNMMFVMLLRVARHIFQACPVWIYTQSQSNITNNLILP